MSRSRKIGTATETAVVRTLRTHGFPYAERRALHGTHDLGDLTGTPGICWEIKGGNAAKTASDKQIAEWLAETERERINSGADIGVLVLQRAGIGPANAHRWWAIVPLGVLLTLHAPDTPRDMRATYPVRLHLGDLCRLLCDAGYGVFPAEQAEVAHA